MANVHSYSFIEDLNNSVSQGYKQSGSMVDVMVDAPEHEMDFRRKSEISELVEDMNMDTVTINYDINYLSSQQKREVQEKLLNKNMKSKKRKGHMPWPFQPLSQEKLNEELDAENNVELESTMWKVMRSKRAQNNYLKLY